MTKIAMIGAGSVTFLRNLLGDIFSRPELRDATITLHDINPERLETAGMMARWIAKHLGANPVIEEYLDRRASLEGADFVINMVMIGGIEGIKTDQYIPQKYGLKQTVGDTVGIGGIMRGLRTIPFMVDLCTDMEAVCPGAILLNYTNPMSILTWAVYKAFPKQKVVGLCHNVQHTAQSLASYLGVPVDRLTYDAAGINHMTFFLRLEIDGEDAYPALRRAMENPEIYAKDKVRFEMFRQFGWFVSESSRHNAEYLPYILRDENEIKRFDIPVAGTLEVNARKLKEYQEERQKLLDGGAFEYKRSVEYGSEIIEAVVTNKPTLIYGNVENTGLIDNLPEGCCVEVPVLVDANGFRPCKAPTLPPELAGYCSPHVFVQDLVVRAALDQDRDRVYRAALLDRHAPSVMTIPRIREMVDELLDVHAHFLAPGLRRPELKAAV